MLDVNALSAGDTVCALIRHGEKDNSHFGLTEDGKAEIERISLLISALHKPVRLYASPECRCMETAVLMGKVIHVTDDSVTFETSEGQVRNQVAK